MNSLSKLIIPLSCTFLLCFACREETIEPDLVGTVKGNILNSVDATPIQGVAVSTNPPTTSTLTDQDGLFFIDNLKVGTYTIRLDKEGFKTKSANLEIKSEEQTDITLNMDPDDRFNQAPNIPALISPLLDQTTDGIDQVKLIWQATDPDDDELFYTLRIYNEDLSFDRIVLQDAPDTSYTFEQLDYSTNYFWQVGVSDHVHEVVYGQIWNFRATDFPLLPYYYAKQADQGAIQIYASDGEQEIMITPDGASRWRPRMNYDKNKIAFIATDNINPHIYLMNIDGSAMTKLTDVSISSIYPKDIDFAWLPDDSGIIYPHFNSLYKVRNDGSSTQELIRLATDRVISECDIAVSSRQIAFLESNLDGYDAHIVLMTPGGTVIDTIFDSRTGRVGGLHFSVDGKQLLFTHDISGLNSPQGRMLNTHIFLHSMTLDTAIDLSASKTNGTNDTDPRFSPNNGKIIFSNQTNNLMSPGNIMTIDVDGTNRQILIEQAFMPDWN